MREIIIENPVVAIMRNVPMEQAVPYVDTVSACGIKAVEVALNSPAALQQIALLKERFGAEIRIGAGTAVTVEKAREAVKAGADFLLSPSVDEDVLCYCAEQNIRLLPGVMTPSDVSLCVRYGFTVLKLFPAGDLPMGYVKSLKGPFDQTDYVAVGGVKKENAAAFFAAGYLGVGVASNLIPKDLLSARDWEGAKQAVQSFMDKIRR